MRRRAWLVMLAMGGCASVGPGSPCTGTPAGDYCLQPTTAVAPFSALQRIDFSMGARHETLVANLEVDAAGLRLAGLTPLGQKVLQVAYDNRRVAIETSLPERVADASQIVALIQLALWPASSVRSGLQDDGVQVQEDGRMRRFVKNGQMFFSISREGEAPPYHRVVLQHPERDMTLTILDLAEGDL